jgi:L-fucose mutarotase
LSLYPIDTFVDDAAGRMEVVGKPDEVPLVQQEVQQVVDRMEGRPLPLTPVERFAFYERAKRAYCVIQTGERRFYGCFAFRKGVVAPDVE